MKNFREKMLEVAHPICSLPVPIVNQLPDTTPIYAFSENENIIIKQIVKPKKASLEITERERANINKVMSQMFGNNNLGNKNIQGKKRERVGWWYNDKNKM